MIKKPPGNLLIEEITEGTKFDDFVRLWVDVFGDEPTFVKSLFEKWGFFKAKNSNSPESKIREFVISAPKENFSGNADNEVVSELTLLECGTLDDINVYVNYAICSDHDFRGLGYGGALTSHAAQIAESENAISILSPAEPSLINFYKSLGYVPYFYAEDIILEVYDSSQYLEIDDSPKCCEFDDSEKHLDIGQSLTVKLTEIDTSTYSDYRENFLAEIPHIRVNDEILNFASHESSFSIGAFLVNDGDAICLIADDDREQMYISELIVNPKLSALSSEIDEQIARLIGEFFDAKKIRYRKPCPVDKDGYCQSMVYVRGNVFRNFQGKGRVNSSEQSCIKPYFGFPMD